jgi:hypothetical protein
MARRGYIRRWRQSAVRNTYNLTYCLLDLRAKSENDPRQLQSGFIVNAMLQQRPRNVSNLTRRRHVGSDCLIPVDAVSSLSITTRKHALKPRRVDFGQCKPPYKLGRLRGLPSERIPLHIHPVRFVQCCRRRTALTTQEPQDRVTQMRSPRTSYPKFGSTPGLASKSCWEHDGVGKWMLFFQ